MTNRTPMDDAARWFLRLQEDSANSETFVEWQRWLAAAPAHAKAYEEIEQTILSLRIPVTPPLPSVKELALDTYDGSVPVEDWKRRRLTMRPAFFRRALAAGVSALALATGAWWLHAQYRAQHSVLAYHTAAGERRAFRLPEGSSVTLDADSTLDVVLSPERRALKLARGEAYFEVAKDVSRPFTVQAGPTQVRALGTAFNVRMSDDRTVVAVTEGKVEVTATSRLESSDRLATELSAGEAVSYGDDSGVHALPVAEVALATGWLKGRRQYRNEPLRYVLADVDRYTGRRIEIESPATGELKFTGTLDLENSNAWLKGLSVALPVSVVEKEGGGLSVVASAGAGHSGDALGAVTGEEARAHRVPVHADEERAGQHDLQDGERRADEERRR